MKNSKETVGPNEYGSSNHLKWTNLLTDSHSNGHAHKNEFRKEPRKTIPVVIEQLAKK